MLQGVLVVFQSLAARHPPNLGKLAPDSQPECSVECWTQLPCIAGTGVLDGIPRNTHVVARVQSFSQS